MTTESVKVTVVIPVKNEEKNLPECLSHLGRFSEVLVVDSGSTDRTLEICEAHGVKRCSSVGMENSPRRETGPFAITSFKTNGFSFLMPTNS